MGFRSERVERLYNVSLCLVGIGLNGVIYKISQDIPEFHEIKNFLTPALFVSSALYSFATYSEVRDHIRYKKSKNTFD